MLLRDLFPIIMMISAVAIVMGGVVGNLSENYEFETSENFVNTYSKINELRTKSSTLQSNIEDTNKKPTFLDSGEILLGSVWNALSVLISSLGYVVSPTGMVSSMARDLNLYDQNSGLAWVPVLITSLVLFWIGFAIASLWLRQKA